MIQSMVHGIKHSWFFKGLLGVAMLSFAVWGVGDAIAPSVDPNVAIKVGNVDVPTEMVQRRFTQEVNRLGAALGQPMATEQAISLGILDQILAELAGDAALTMAAQDMDIVISDDAVRERVTSDPAFQDESGNFSTIIYQQTLQVNNLNEQLFIDLVKTELRQRIMYMPVAEGIAPPQDMVDLLFRYRAEQRIADTLFIPDASVGDIGEPSETDLQAVYDNNIAAFTAPEYRALDAIFLVATDLVPPSSISREDLEAFYDENLDRYSTPASRDISQLIFDSQEEAQAVYDQRQPDDTLASLAERAGLAPPMSVGQVTANDTSGLVPPSVFQYAAGEISPPTQTDFGWHLFEADNISGGSVKALPVVEDEIREFIVRDRSIDAMYEAMIYVEDELAAGAPMSEIAETLGVRYLHIDAIDREGRDPSGAQVDVPTEKQRFLTEAFNTPLGLESDVVELENSSFIVRVDDVVERAPKPFDSVRNEVRSLWESQTRAAATATRAEEIAASLGPSSDFPALAEEQENLTFARLGPVTRFGDSLRLDYIIDAKLTGPAVMEKLFNAEVGQVVTARAASGHVIARLAEIVPGTKDDLPDTVAQIETALGSSLENDILTQLSSAIGERYETVFNEEALDAAFPR